MKSTAQRKTSKHSKTSKHKWSAGVKTDSTFPPAGTFTKPGDEVARIMATRKVSPGGLGSAIKMVQMFNQSVRQQLKRGPQTRIGKSQTDSAAQAAREIRGKIAAPSDRQARALRVGWSSRNSGARRRFNAGTSISSSRAQRKKISVVISIR